jgi:hypothetical protein
MDASLEPEPVSVVEKETPKKREGESNGQMGLLSPFQMGLRRSETTKTKTLAGPESLTYFLRPVV